PAAPGTGVGVRDESWPPPEAGPVPSPWSARRQYSRVAGRLADRGNQISCSRPTPDKSRHAPHHGELRRPLTTTESLANQPNAGQVSAIPTAIVGNRFR